MCVYVCVMQSASSPASLWVVFLLSLSLSFSVHHHLQTFSSLPHPTRAAAASVPPSLPPSVRSPPSFCSGAEGADFLLPLSWRRPKGMEDEAEGGRGEGVAIERRRRERKREREKEKEG